MNHSKQIEPRFIAGPPGTGKTHKFIVDTYMKALAKYTPEKIISIRKKFRLSQAALASIFNISPSTVQKWEQGNKKPTGASRKLLDIMERKGINALI